MRFLRAILALICVLTLNAHAAFNSFNAAQPGGGGGSTPTLVQHVGSTVNDNNGIAGNGFVFTMPNTVLSHNALVLGLVFPYSGTRTVAISDSSGDTWPSASVTTTDSTNMEQQIYVLPNATAAIHNITVTFDASIKPFGYEISEFYNVATSSPVDVTHGAASVASPNVAAGSMTTTANGDLIWAFTRSNDKIGTNSANAASTIAPTASMSLLSADNTCTIPGAASYFVQTTAGAINPGWTVTQSTGTSFVSSAVALKAASAGTAPSAGIRIKRVLHQTYVISGANTNAVFQFPSDGNLLYASFPGGDDIVLFNTPTDSNSQSWTTIGGASGQPYCWYKQNATPANNLKLTIPIGAMYTQSSFRFLDIVGAQASSFDTTAGVYTANPSTGNVSPALPTLTPTSAPGLSITTVGFGTGPGTGMGAGSPSGAVFILVNYTGETDQDRMDNADAMGIVYYPTTAAQNWIFSIANASRGSTAFGTAASFK